MTAGIMSESIAVVGDPGAVEQSYGLDNIAFPWPVRILGVTWILTNAGDVEIEVNAFTYNDGDYQLMFGEGDSENNPYIAAGDNFVGEDPVAIFYVPDEGTEFLNAGTVIGLAAPSVPEPDEGDTTGSGLKMVFTYEQELSGVQGLAVRGHTWRR